MSPDQQRALLNLSLCGEGFEQRLHPKSIYHQPKQTTAFFELTFSSPAFPADCLWKIACKSVCVCVCVARSNRDLSISLSASPGKRGKVLRKCFITRSDFFSRLSSENLEPKKSSPNKRPYKQFSLRSNCDGYLYFSLFWFVAGHCESGVGTGFRIMWGQKNRLETGLDLDTGVVVVVRDRVHFLSLSISGRFAQDLPIA